MRLMIEAIVYYSWCCLTLVEVYNNKIAGRYNASNMLRDLITASLLALAAIAIHLRDGKTAFGLLVVIVAHMLLGRAERKPVLLLQGELKRLAVGLARTMLLLAGAAVLLAGFNLYSWHDIDSNALLIGIALVPGSLMLAMHAVMPRAKGRLGLHNLVKILRCSLTTITGKLALVVISIVSFGLWQTAPAINGPQLLAIDIIGLAMPLTALGHDVTRHKLKRQTVTELRHELTAWRAVGGFVGFGGLTAVLAYGNYLLFFARHHLSPAHLDLSLPLYHQATTLTYLTLVLCLYVHLMFERADAHDRLFTDYLLDNEQLLRAFGLSLFLIVNIVYNPWLQSFFSSGALGLVDWLTALLVAALYVVFRLTQRHTRKHTRHAVLKLHREIHS